MQQTKTYMARPGEIEPKWWLVDATDKVVGRLASDIAMVLMGRIAHLYAPRRNGDYVMVINAGKVVLTGKKWSRRSTPGTPAIPGQYRQTAGHPFSDGWN